MGKCSSGGMQRDAASRHALQHLGGVRGNMICFNYQRYLDRRDLPSDGTMADERMDHSRVRGLSDYHDWAAQVERGSVLLGGREAKDR